MTNFEKLNRVINHIQFMIDEGLIAEGACGSIREEVYSSIEILVDCNPEIKKDFEKDMEELKA